MQVKSALLLVSMFLASAVFASQSTDLSGKAAKLRDGMTRSEVVALLGRATWAAIPKDTGDFELSNKDLLFALYWKNRPCSPVVVDFSVSGNVVGWDEGRGVCGADMGHLKLEPPASLSCAKADRARLCR